MDNKNNEAVDGVVASEEISLEEQQAVLEKFDQESNTRNVTGFAKGFIKWYAIAMAVFHVYTSFFGLWATIRQRAMHLLFVMPLCYLMYPAKKGGARNNPSLLDWVFAALSFVCCGYIVVNYDAIFLRGGLPNQMDIIMGCLCALLVLEAVRRVVGTQLLIIAVIFLGYAYFGRYMPGILRHRGDSIARMVDHMYMAPEGIFSTALGTSATFIVLFVIFAAFLQKSGMADLIRDLAMALAGGSVGGPAKVSVVTSAAFGTISGSAAANVVTTGAFTIPLMKSTGYEPEFAGAVEAVSSTGGQLMPPIMGSAAFIMADYLGIPYVTIIKAAIIPVLLYYLSIFVSVHYRAKKLGLKGVSRENLPNAWEVFKERGHLLVPFVVVVFLLMNRYTPIFAGCAGIISCILSAALKKETRMGIRDIIDSLENGAKGCVSVAISCASVGLVIGVCISQAIGTGGRDLSQDVGGITMLQGIDFLKNDPETDVVVLVSKPPHPETAKKIYSAVSGVGKPAVVYFLGGNRAEIESYGVYSAASLEDAAAIAVALELKQPLPSRDFQARIETEYLELAKEEASMLSGSQKYLRGLFCGGTHSEEAVLLLKNMVSDLHSNISFGGAKLLEDPKKSIGNSLVDMGDEVFTRGKPHPVIDPSVMIDRIIEEGSNPETAVILFDLLLGHGCSPDPVGVIFDALKEVREKSEAAGRHLCMICDLCGTEKEPQNYAMQKKVLEELGVHVFESNAQAAIFAGMVTERRG